MVIARRDFRDEEYFIPQDIFNRHGILTTTSGSKTGVALGVMGGEAEITLNLRDAKAEDFDGVVFVGGSGAQEYFDNKEAHRIAREFSDAGKIVGAICIAPVILAKAGILKGKVATVWQDAMDKTGPKALKANDCALSEKSVEISGNIITANGREAAEEFARKIVEEMSFI